MLKVGKANNVDERFHFLRRENAPELTLIGRIPGDEELECEIHTELGEPIHNEWFEFDAAAQEIVSRYLQESIVLPVEVLHKVNKDKAEDVLPTSSNVFPEIQNQQHGSCSDPNF
jgi:hypothetical protein